MTSGSAENTMRLNRSKLALPIVLSIGLSITCGGSGGSGSPTAPEAQDPPPPPPPTASASATYRVTFDAIWSAQTHPTGIPNNPHFSPLVGATHAEDTRFWETGGTASDGIKAMAEQGKTTPLDNEIEQAIAQGAAEVLLLGGPVNSSPGTVKLEFTATLEHSWVTLVSMLAPSPDWYVGVSALPLLENGDWAQRIDVELFAYDAGTDGGKNYTSKDQPLSPRIGIARIEGKPFAVNGNLVSVGTFTFRRLS